MNQCPVIARLEIDVRTSTRLVENRVDAVGEPSGSKAPGSQSKRLDQRVGHEPGPARS